MTGKVDIIIPYYNAQSTIEKALHSIASQTISNEVIVTIVDDCSTDGSYEWALSRYFDGLDVRILQTPQNGGPGVARQYGIDHTECPYMMFLDADDTLGDSLSVETLYSTLSGNDAACMVIGSFDEECNEEIRRHDGDMVWMHGKIYRRAFIDQYGVRFHKTSRANEDNGFNTIIKLIVAHDTRWKLLTSDRVVYTWHNVKHSMTRDNNHEYYFGASFPGFVENMIYASQHLRLLLGDENLVKSEYYRRWVTVIMCFLYAYYSECYRFAPDRAMANLIACKSFYNLVYKEMDSKIPIDDVAKIYTQTMTASYKRFDYIPAKTIFDFINDLKER